MAESRRPIPTLGGSRKNHAKIAATFIDERNGDSDDSGDKNRSTTIILRKSVADSSQQWQ
ncbi:hypothetical protein C1H46_016119 [Malus baccata]|uniref:Uncharacterized protein n=1 Tax=Malus baccata TaxID=106549 RepID=A0A540MHR1_MALBA|nr:hypothetical protein C1H46_016119 [Malus baccata]